MTQRVALVTGAMGGIGSAISKALIQDGLRVIAAYHPEFDNKENWLNEMQAEGFQDVPCIAADITRIEDCQSMVEQAQQQTGAPISVLINNAGITRDKMFHRMEQEQWEAVISTNLSSIFNVTRQVVPGMVEAGWGRIVNISSLNAVKGQAGQTNYSAAKSGIIGFTKALAQELAAKGVTVNAIAPGYVATKMVQAIREDVLQGIIDTIPMKRLAKPDEIGALCVYLISEPAAYMTGATLNINGGLYCQ